MGRKIPVATSTKQKNPLPRRLRIRATALKTGAAPTNPPQAVSCCPHKHTYRSRRARSTTVLLLQEIRGLRSASGDSLITGSSIGRRRHLLVPALGSPHRSIVRYSSRRATNVAPLHRQHKGLLVSSVTSHIKRQLALHDSSLFDPRECNRVPAQKRGQGKAHRIFGSGGVSGLQADVPTRSNHRSYV